MVLHRVVVGKIYSRALAHHGGKARVKNALFQSDTGLQLLARLQIHMLLSEQKNPLYEYCFIVTS